MHSGTCHWVSQQLVSRGVLPLTLEVTLEVICRRRGASAFGLSLGPQLKHPSSVFPCPTSKMLYWLERESLLLLYIDLIFSVSMA